MSKIIRRAQNLQLGLRKNWALYICLLPFMIVFFTFTILPVFRAISYSFTDFNILQSPDFVGVKNYKTLLLDDNIFVKSIINTVLFAVATGPLGYLLSLLLAWVINDFGRALRTVLVVIFYAPSISGQLYLIWSLIFSGDSLGYANVILTRVGIINEPIQWLNDPKYMMPIMIIVALWMSMGTGFLSLVAGLQGVDRGLYESGAIDGIKNRFQELWYITIPAIRPQMMFSAVMSIISAFASAEIMVNLAGFPSTDYAAHTIMTHLQDYGSLRFEMGYACAIATMLFAIMLAVNKVVQRLLKGVG